MLIDSLCTELYVNDCHTLRTSLSLRLQEGVRITVDPGTPGEDDRTRTVNEDDDWTGTDGLMNTGSRGQTTEDKD